MRRMLLSLLCGALLVNSFSSLPSHAATKMYSFTAEIWADNWFALYVNGKKVGEDSTPFKTERSFNSDRITFTASYPLTVGIIARDYVEDSSGLEYIGKPNQQIGDGGLIAQIREKVSGKIVGATNKSWKIYVTNKAPLNAECVTSSNPIQDCKSSSPKAPSHWYSSTFKDSSWKNATEYTEAAVGVKDGFFDITWDSSAALLWSSDLRIDNTILLRTRIVAPKSSRQTSAQFAVGSPDFNNGGMLSKENTCDGAGISPALTFSGVPPAAKSLAVVMDTVPGPPRPGEVDTGKHVYLVLYDIPATTTSIAAGATNVGTLGQNFQGRNLGYAPPCSQGPGVKEYTFTAFALSDRLGIDPALSTADALLKAVAGKIISQATLIARYQRA